MANQRCIVSRGELFSPLAVTPSQLRLDFAQHVINAEGIKDVFGDYVSGSLLLFDNVDFGAADKSRLNAIDAYGG